MSFNYLFICDMCGKRIEEQKELTFCSSDTNFNIFVKDSSWELYPKGWIYNPIKKNIICENCLERLLKECKLPSDILEIMNFCELLKKKNEQTLTS